MSFRKHINSKIFFVVTGAVLLVASFTFSTNAQSLSFGDRLKLALTKVQNANVSDWCSIGNPNAPFTKNCKQTKTITTADEWCTIGNPNTPFAKKCGDSIESIASANGTSFSSKIPEIRIVEKAKEIISNNVSNYVSSVATPVTNNVDQVASTQATQDSVINNYNDLLIKTIALNYYKESGSVPKVAPAANQTGAVAIGEGAQANQINSIAIGNSSTVNGTESVVIGSSVAEGDNNNIFGSGNSTNKGLSQVVVGNKNVSEILNSSSYIFGLSNTNKGDSNLFSFGNENTVGASSFSGDKNLFALGSANSLSGTESFVLGSQNNILNTNNVFVLGKSNRVDNGVIKSFAIGNNNLVSKSNSFTVGNNNTINAEDAFVFGSNLNNNLAGSVDIGTNNNTKLTVASNGKVGLRGALSLAGNDGQQGQVLVSNGQDLTPGWNNVGALLTAGAGITISGNTISANATGTGGSLTPSGVTAGTYGSASAIPILTVNTYGQITSAATTSLNTSNVSEGANLYFTNARSIGSVLTGFSTSSATGTAVTSSDSVLVAFAKLQNAINNLSVSSSSHVAVTLGTPNGLSLINQEISLGLASTSTTGALSASDFTAFNNKLSAAIISLNGQTNATQSFATSSTGNDFGFSSSAGVHTLSIPRANVNGVVAGTISNADYVSFNNKLSSATGTAGQILAVNGAGTTTTFSLYDTAVSTGSYGSSTAVATFTVDQKGRLTAAGATTIANLTSSNLSATAGITNGQLANSSITINAGTGLSGTSTIALGGSATLALANVGTAGTYGSSLVIPTITTDAQGRVTSVSTSSIPTASSTATGVLSSSDYSTFSNKVSSATGTTGRIINTGSLVNPVFDLYTTGVSANTYNNVTVDVYGRVTNGSNVSYLTSAITTLNGQTQATQSFATSSTGNDFGFSSTGGVHTLSIPRAVNSGVVAGTISNSDYVSFNNKLSSATGTTGQILATNGAGTTTVFSLYDTAVTPGSYGSSTAVATFTVDQKGRLTAAGATTIANLTSANLSASANIANSQLANSSFTTSIGTAGSDVNVSGSPTSLGGTLTLNIPDATNTARGLVNTGTQTFGGAKTFTSNPTFSSMTAGSILFAGASGLVSQNNSQLFWDNTNNRLGVGASVPTYKLDVVDSMAGNQVVIRSQNTSTASGNTTASMFVQNSSSYGQLYKAGTGYTTYKTVSANDLGFYNATAGNISILNDSGNINFAAGGVSTPQMIINTNGNVGIGTTTPAQLLSVAGNMRLTGALFDGTNASGTNGMVLLSTGTSTNWVATSSLGISGGSGITSLNGLTASTQTFATSTTGNDFGFSSVGSVHTLNIPDASATARGVVTTGTQTFAGVKTFSSNPIFSGLTQGRIRFSTSSGAVADSANFIWDDNLTRFGIGTSTPAATFGLKGIAGSNPFLVASSSNAALFSILQNGNVGIGTTTPSSILAINGARPSLTIRNSSNGQQFQFKSGVQSTTTADISLFDATSNKTIFSADGDMFRVGTTSNSIIGNSSRMFVYGGTNGANIDVMGDGGIIGGDQATLELEGSDWGLDGDPKSVLLQYQGTKGLGSTAGFANQNLGILMFSGATTTGIIGTSNANPVVFFTDYAERGRFAANGFFGLGTTSPAERLSVAGNILATGTLTMQGTATSTFNGGINLITSGGCFAINGSCVGGTGGSGITSLNGLTGSSQTFATSTTGNDFGFSSVGSVHTLNIPDASATARGVVTTGNQTFAGVKTFSSNPIFSALTQGSIPFIGASGALSQSNSQLFWDNTNSRLGLGTTSPQQKLDVWGNVQVGTSSTPTFLVNSAIGAVSIGGGTVLPNSPLQIGGNVNSYLQVNIQNRSNGSSASSDLVLTNDTGSDSINYLDIGINSSGYNDAAYTITGANDAYIYSQSHSLSIGTASSSANVALEFFTGGTLAANERMRITSTGNVGIGTTTPNQKLTVAGDALVTGTSTLATTSAASLSVSGTTTLGTANSQNGILAFQSALNSFITYLRSSSTAASNLTFTLPGTAGTSGNVLKSDGNGGMFWGAVTASGAVTLGPSSADTLNSANSGIMINQQGSGSLLQLQQGGLDKFVVANTGGLTINGATSNITKTTTADFALGTVGSNLTNSGNRIEMSDGTVPNSGKGTITTAGQVTTSATLGAGALAITRPDGYYLIIRGGGGTGMDIYNSLAATTSASAQTLTGNAGAGALALPRPDGRYLVIHGGGLTTSSLVDPKGFASVVAGPAVTASNAGTVAFKRFDGRFIYTNGGAVTTQIYDIVANTVAAGPSLTTGTAGAGALWLARPDGQALLVVGGATGNSQLYNQSSATGNIGVFAAGPTLGTGCEINGAGSVAFKRQDGKYVVLSKANASTVYDPYLNTFTCSTSNGPATALGDGAHAIPMQNGNFLIVVGGNSTASYVYDPVANTYTSHGTALTAVTTGGFSLMNLDGTWQIFAGGGTASTKLDTGLPMTGSTTLYTSEDISSTALSPRSTIRWTGQYEAAYVGGNAAGQSSNSAYSTLQFFVRTATSTAALSYPTVSDREIQYSGDLLRASTTDAAIRIKVQFNRVIPKRIVDERGTWTGNGSTVNRFDYVTPSLFDLVVDNGAALHRGLADFALPNAAFNGAQSENSGPVTTRAEANVAGIQLPYGRLPATTMVSAPLTYYMGASAAANGSIPQAQTNEGTVVIARPNKTFVVIASLSTPAANAALYDPSTHSFTAQSGSNIPTAANGIGGFALKRPDGKFLVALGNSTNVTNIYDPTANTFSAGPNLTGVANTGASAIPNNDGTFTIVHGGGLLTSSLYDPVRNTMIAGPVLTAAANCGFSATPLQNGTYKVIVGAAYGAAAVATTMTYNPNTKVFVAGTNMTTAMGCGSFTFQRPDGYWLAVAAASTTATNIMNPIDGTTLAGPALTAAAYSGAHVIPRADGTFLIIHASSTTALSSIYIPQGSTFGVGSGIGTMPVGPAMPQVFGRGAVSFQRPDGKWVMIIGGASSTVNTIDTGWYADGQYLSEQMPVPALAANSILEWKQTPDNFVRIEVRASTSQTGLAAAPYKTLSVSGSSIENSGNETWAQVAINFRRDFPTYGLLPDVYNSGGGRAYPMRTISLPTVTEYKINNGTDLMSLQNNGLNVMRVTTSGNVYTAANGGFYSGGADLAERYSSKDYLEPGDVVVSDYMINHGVKKSTGAYQEGMLGVVSTAPGFVAGAFTEDSYPIALVGRVPVKVSTENGSIKAGDYLTSASIPGYAMKATYAGRVIGKAMEDLNETNMKTCPGVAAGLRDSVKCGTIMMFVTLVDYKGGSIQVAMDEWASVRNSNTTLADDNGLDVLGLADTGVVANGSSTPISVGFGDVATTHDRDVLKFLKELKAEKESNLNGQSDVFAQNVHVISEIIAPKIVTDIIAAREAHITNISGFQVNTENLTARNIKTEALESMTGDVGFRFTADGRMVMYTKATSTATSTVLVNATSTDEFATTTATSTDEFATSTASTTELSATSSDSIFSGLGEGEVMSFDMSGNAFFAGELVAKEIKTESLKVTGQTVLGGGLMVNTIGSDDSVLQLLGDVEFFGRPYFNRDMGGTAIIKKDAKAVEIIFDKEYIEAPSVVASISFADEATTTLEAKQSAVFDNDLKFVVTKRTTKGFVILLNKPATNDVTFMWMALAIKNAKVFTSAEVATSTETNTFTTSNDNVPGDTSTSTNAISSETTVSTSTESTTETSNTNNQTNSNETTTNNSSSEPVVTENNN